MRPLLLRSSVCVFVLALAAGCSDAKESAGGSGGNGGTPSLGGGGGANDKPVVAGKKVALSLSEADQRALAALSEQVGALESLTTTQLLAKHAVKHVELGYDPSTSKNLDLIQKSAIQLDDAELAVLKEHGFVISARQSYPYMLYGYDTIYMSDLPVYVSADSILDAVHRSYDKMLADVETRTLIPELDALLDGMRSALAKRASDAGAKDADFFLAVAKSLLDAKVASPVAGANAKDVASFFSQASAASGHAERVIFGSQRDIDFSQFEPRGHYTDTEALQRYFRAMMWLGRIDLRLIETQPNGDQVFHRDQLETTVLLSELAQGEALEHWNRVDRTVETFVGKSDYMRLPEVASLLEALGAKSVADLAKLGDAKIAQAILNGGYGAQQIASQLIVNATDDGHTLPLDRSFALFGQRYVIDSHVFSNVVFDRVPDRFMPNPLDAAYAALGNDQAAKLLEPELEKYEYAPALESMRTLVDAHDDAFWSENLYNLWLRSLRALSPSSETADPAKAGMPTITGTEAWGRRVLSTQLGSWAQLRHDTILYAKQSYTSGAACEFPDAYVDPYPAFFDALAKFAQSGSALADTLAGGGDDATTTNIRAYFDHLASAMQKLGDMARAERKGEAFTAEQMQFINDIVRNNNDGVCVDPPTYSGWYAELIYGASADKKVRETFEPTIADVHTQPTDEAGNDVGRVLHVGTGYSRLMVVTVDGCDGPRAYAGVASSYYELITDNWKRLNDQDWEQMLQGGGSGTLAEVPWTTDFVANSAAAQPQP